MTITTRLYTFFHGEPVGTDQFGNRYYTEKNPPSGRREKRWVIYNGLAEPSKIPPEWHGWMHYTLDAPLALQNIRHYSWQKPSIPNLTGTPGAYLPAGHLLKSAKHAPTTADYEAWKP